jgi:putative glutamine amidotransferase
METMATQLPLIGLTGGLTHNPAGSDLCQVGQAYVTAVRQAGGIPLLIPTGLNEDALPALVARLDGILLTGGGDLDPALFKGAPHPRVYGVSPARDALELRLVKETLAAGKPLLAICRGIQVLNVAFGGTLHTDIQDQVPNALKHDWFPDYPRDRLSHTVSLKCSSPLHDIFGQDDIPVNSLHHQGLARVGSGLEAIGFAPDGLVEAVSVKGAAFALGVQWHPECLPDDPGMQALFQALVDAC